MHGAFWLAQNKPKAKVHCQTPFNNSESKVHCQSPCCKNTNGVKQWTLLSDFLPCPPDHTCNQQSTKKQPTINKKPPQSTTWCRSFLLGIKRLGDSSWNGWACADGDSSSLHLAKTLLTSLMSSSRKMPSASFYMKSGLGTRPTREPTTACLLYTSPSPRD